MARPQKEGLDYFPFDVDFFENDKVKLISAEFGGWKGELVMIRLLAKIYKNGYYYKWGKDECLLLTKAIGAVDCSYNFIQEVIAGLVRRCFFDKEYFNQFGVLTSTSIQEVYVKATVERKSLKDRPYWLLLSSDETPFTEVNPPNNGVNPPINPQIKGKKNKTDITTFIAPSVTEFVDYFILNGFPAELGDRVFKGYDVVDWYDTRGNKIKSWKQKCQQVWFKPDNKATANGTAYGARGAFTPAIDENDNKPF